MSPEQRFQWQWDLMKPTSATARQNIIVLDTETGVCYTGLPGGGRGYIEAELGEMVDEGEL